MNEEQFRALLAFIDARIEEKIEDAFGRDSVMESVRADALRADLHVALGL